MICEQCRKGGDLNTEGKYNASDSWHYVCHIDKTPGCFCQHRVGPGIVQGRDDVSKDRERLRA